MPEEFDGDLTEAVFWGADLKGATFRDVDLTGARISHSMVVDVEIDAVVDRLVVNGVDVTGYVNERDPWYPLRTMTQPTSRAEMLAGLSALEEAWAATIEFARTLPEPALHQSVGGEFSFVETLRHVVFAVDKWFTAPILGEPFAAMGLPNRGSLEFPWPGLDYALEPTADEALALRADRMDRVRRFVTALTDDDDLGRRVEILENGPNALHDCIGVVIEEGFWHNRYAARDLATLA
jgi:hypothetical protein